MKEKFDLFKELGKYFEPPKVNVNHPCCSCDGHEESECCGAIIINHDICSDCGEHADNKCVNCDLKNQL